MHCKAGKKQQICNRRFEAETFIEVARWGYMYSIFACPANAPAFSNARGLYQGTMHVTETCLWQQGSMLGSDQLSQMVQLLRDR